MLTAQLPDTEQSSWKHLIWVLLVGFLIFYTAYSYHTTQQNRVKNKVEMKSSGRSGKHANPKTKQSASEKYEEAKTAFEKLSTKPSKTTDDKVMLEKLRNQMKHWKKKKDWSGEQHSQKNKGN
ncbi:MAG: hypothetical protein ACKVU0_02640 [Saprospiraceae bacterium]